MPRARSERGGWDLRRLPIIIFRRLGREDAYGLANHPLFAEVTPCKVPVITLDPEITGLKRLEIAIHEALHIAVPGLPESPVRYASRFIAKVLWALGYRADDEDMEERFTGNDPNR